MDEVQFFMALIHTNVCYFVLECDCAYVQLVKYALQNKAQYCISVEWEL